MTPQTHQSAITPGDFSPVVAGKSGGSGPSSNTGQKVSIASGFACSIDYLTVSIPMTRLEECASTDLRYLLSFLFGGSALLTNSGRTGKHWQFYRDSAYIFDREGAVCGRIGMDGNGGTMCVSLTGEGCRWVENWRYVHTQLEIVRARISRCDVALDDFHGQLFDPQRMSDAAVAGLFAEAGRPPKTRFLDDHGHNTGRTLYVGNKGHKQLCVYEKGKQLKDETSPWVRAECRFYGKHTAGVPLDVLLQPIRYFRGAYSYMADLTSRIVAAAPARVAIVRAKVEACANACVSWLRTQTGPTLNLLFSALGPEADAFLRTNVARPSPPSRFRHLGAANQLPRIFREQLECMST